MSTTLQVDQNAVNTVPGVPQGIMAVDNRDALRDILAQVCDEPVDGVARSERTVDLPGRAHVEGFKSLRWRLAFAIGHSAYITLIDPANSDHLKPILEKLRDIHPQLKGLELDTRVPVMAANAIMRAVVLDLPNNFPDPPKMGQLEFVACKESFVDFFRQLHSKAAESTTSTGKKKKKKKVLTEFPLTEPLDQEIFNQLRRAYDEEPNVVFWKEALIATVGEQRAVLDPAAAFTSISKALSARFASKFGKVEDVPGNQLMWMPMATAGQPMPMTTAMGNQPMPMTTAMGNPPMPMTTAMGNLPMPMTTATANQPMPLSVPMPMMLSPTAPCGEISLDNDPMSLLSQFDLEDLKVQLGVGSPIAFRSGGMLPVNASPRPSPHPSPRQCSMLPLSEDPPPPSPSLQQCAFAAMVGARWAISSSGLSQSVEAGREEQRAGREEQRASTAALSQSVEASREEQRTATAALSQTVKSGFEIAEEKSAGRHCEQMDAHRRTIKDVEGVQKELHDNERTRQEDEKARKQKERRAEDERLAKERREEDEREDRRAQKLKEKEASHVLQSERHGEQMELIGQLPQQAADQVGEIVRERDANAWRSAIPGAIQVGGGGGAVRGPRRS